MATRITLQLRGTKALISALKRREGAVFQRCKQVQNATARDILVQSNIEVPKDTFATVKSARMQEDKAGKRHELRTLAVTYNTDYAMIVHEDMNMKHAPGTNAKFLERPAKKQRKRYINDMRAAVREGSK